jgi:two-component system chemotaxis response regulator CheB
MAEDNEPIQRGFIYLAQPDSHLMIKPGAVSVQRGPRENRWRPAIDTLFRSAAVTYGPSVIGVILTGLLSDGAVGLDAVKRCGGVAIIQDPKEALFPEMPQNAADAVAVDYVVPIAKMGALLTRLAQNVVKKSPPIPRDVMLEQKIMEKQGVSDIFDTEKLGDLSTLVCPECGGNLWELTSSGLQRYRCHLGHAYTAKDLLVDQDGSLERALWGAQRVLGERAKILANLARDERRQGRDRTAKNYEERSEESKGHAEVIRSVLLKETT